METWQELNNTLTNKKIKNLTICGRVIDSEWEHEELCTIQVKIEGWDLETIDNVIDKIQTSLFSMMRLYDIEDGATDIYIEELNKITKDWVELRDLGGWNQALKAETINKKKKNIER